MIEPPDSATLPGMSYPGGKSGPGVYQTLINQIPPHEVYVAAFGGHDAILQHKRPASRNIILDRDRTPLDKWAQAASPDLEIYQCDAVAWLEQEFGLLRYQADENSGGVLASQNQWFVYVDPPYPLSTRTSGPMYRHELTDDDHQRLLAVLQQLPAMVMVSSYPNCLYENALQGWRTADFFSTCRSGERRRERIWMNYPEPQELHDYSFVGADKRERERIRKRGNNWASELARLDPLERGAILQAIDDRLSSSA